MKSMNLEEATENFSKAEQRHQEILALPPWHKQVEAHAQGSSYACTTEETR
jgi:hypothetical protein